VAIVEKLNSESLPSILVVDDQSNNRKLFKNLLHKIGYTADEADSGEQALELMNQKSYDLIVSDLHMYNVSGLDVLAAAKQKDENTQVLILTGFGSIQAAVNAMRNGAYDFLTKPINHEEFYAKVKKSLDRRRIQILLEEQQDKVARYHETIERDLNLARKIHDTLIPENIDTDGYALALHYMPMIGLGGDFAYVFDNQNGQLYITVIDITGHGIAAALLVNRICSEVAKFMRDELEPREILFQLNKFFCDSFCHTGMFATVMIAQINFQNKEMIYSGSAHPALFHYGDGSSKLHFLESQNTIIGFDYSSQEKFVQDSIKIASGDKIILYTDGVLESENSRNKVFGMSGLRSAIKKAKSQNAEESVETVIAELMNFCKQEFRDDVLLLVTEIK
jgi:serine phosphatase RsbU (regulator of sigma subunit)